MSGIKHLLDSALFLTLEHDPDCATIRQRERLMELQKIESDGIRLSDREAQEYNDLLNAENAENAAIGWEE